METVRLITQRTRRYLMALIRTRVTFDPELAHQLRVKVARGITDSEATALIDALKAIPEPTT